MLTFSVELTACIIESIICVYFLMAYFGLKTDSRKLFKFLIFFFGTMTTELLVTYGDISETLCMFLTIGLFWTFSVVFLNGKTVSKLLVSALIYFIIIAVNVATVTLFSAILTENYSSLIGRMGITRIIILIITKAALFLILQLILKSKKRTNLFLSVTEYLTVLITFFTTTSVLLIIRYILKTNTLNPELFVIAVSCMIFLNIITIFFIVKISQKNKARVEVELLNLEFEQQKHNALEIDRRYNEILTIRHDMRNYISCACALAEQGDYRDLNDYLKKLSDTRIGKAKVYVKTPSSILDAVLNDKITTALERSIDVKYDVMCELGDIQDIDMGILMGNLLDNAIEACKKNHEPSCIDFKIVNSKSFIVIVIKNTCNRSVITNGRFPETTKNDTKNHGLGLKSVSDIVGRYYGNIEFRQQEGIFEVNIVLPTNRTETNFI